MKLLSSFITSNNIDLILSSAEYSLILFEVQDDFHSGLCEDSIFSQVLARVCLYLSTTDKQSLTFFTRHIVTYVDTIFSHNKTAVISCCGNYRIYLCISLEKIKILAGTLLPFHHASLVSKIHRWQNHI